MSKGLAGGGIRGKTSVALQVHVVGRQTVKIVPFSIKNHRRAAPRRIGKRLVPNADPPYFVERADQAFHFGGNSICYALQWALLMEADPIYLMGFTLQSGTPYEFGQTNPATGKPSFYRDIWRPLEWLKAFEDRFPGRARLLPGWTGPIYDVFQVDKPKPRVTVPWLI